MAVSAAHTRASIKYNKSRDNITIRPTKEDGAEIRQAAEAAGRTDASRQNEIMPHQARRIIRRAFYFA